MTRTLSLVAASARVAGPLLLGLLMAVPAATTASEGDPQEAQEPVKARAEPEPTPTMDFLLYLARWDAADAGWLGLLEDDADGVSAKTDNGVRDDQ